MPIAAAFAFGVFFTLAWAWSVMVLIGAIHSHVPAVPAFGYGASLLLVILVSVLLVPVLAGRDS